MMAVGTSVAVVCLESVVDAEERRRPCCEDDDGRGGREQAETVGDARVVAPGGEFPLSQNGYGERDERERRRFA